MQVTLEQVLDRLQENFFEYLRSVPSLFCDEVVQSDFGPANTVVKSVHSKTESIFRLQRKITPARKLELVESRDLKRVDGKAVSSGSLAGPAILSGAFGTGLAVADAAQEVCTNFRMHPMLTFFAPHRIVIEFESLPGSTDNPVCSTRRSHGRVFVDPETMRIRRIEMTTPNYDIVPKIKGNWVWSVDYDPVMLGGKPFWLPKTILSDATSYGLNPLTWTFEARYSNYHKLEVRSRIVTDGLTEPGPEPSETAPQAPKR
ncbi:hypothetical protein GRAN_1945 [Granulicella sibirica]|uniref:Uncharacterized protein n=1 Tax=Granulicella sibirica TaxID=2479048 RepID=A0A4Q0T4H8_9BACT|nr:hypothetical protein GRAN_1945 [Granulicella sibirica]